MDRIMRLRIVFLGSSRVAAIISLLTICTLASCNPSKGNKKSQGEAAFYSEQDSLLGERYPLPEHLFEQRSLLAEHSRKDRLIPKTDEKSLQGNFDNGKLDLIFDKIDGEPFFFYGHLAEPQPQTQMEFVVNGIPTQQLDSLVPGKIYQVHWMETVVDFQPFDEDRYRYFVAWKIEEAAKRKK